MRQQTKKTILALPKLKDLTLCDTNAFEILGTASRLTRFVMEGSRIPLHFPIPPQFACVLCELKSLQHLYLRSCTVDIGVFGLWLENLPLLQIVAVHELTHSGTGPAGPPELVSYPNLVDLEIGKVSQAISACIGSWLLKILSIETRGFPFTVPAFQGNGFPNLRVLTVTIPNNMQQLPLALEAIASLPKLDMLYLTLFCCDDQGSYHDIPLTKFMLFQNLSYLSLDLSDLPEEKKGVIEAVEEFLSYVLPLSCDIYFLTVHPCWSDLCLSSVRLSIVHCVLSILRMR
mmetsp:Transcript_36818/g.59540  ORF Transcript_36818/g.59540 Transcript_36818/m.59540 type:complete len:288 (+) Transcript_36818:640-1503(+)